MGIALQLYSNRYGSFPPAYLADADGQPTHSWRVLVLPFIGDPELEQLYSRYDFDEPWDGPHNRQLAEQTPEMFCYTDRENPQETNFLAVVGPETGWPGSATRSLPEIRDSPEFTIALVEVAHSGIHWMEPRDMTLEQAIVGVNARQEGPYISSDHSTGAKVLWYDGRVTSLPDSISADTLRPADRQWRRGRPAAVRLTAR